MKILSEDIVSAPVFQGTALSRALFAEDALEIENLRKRAEDIREAVHGPNVYYRALIEVSNRCVKNCHYCGIRRGNRALERFTMTIDEIVFAARLAANCGLGSICLQAGERQDEPFIAFIEKAIGEIGKATRSETLPQGVGITLSLGEQSEATYARWMAACINPHNMRYLLRFETSDETLFQKLHASSSGVEKTLTSRLTALKALRETGYQVGTGFMIGIPGQTRTTLIQDVELLKALDPDMVGMGPFLFSDGAKYPMHSPYPPERLLQIAMNTIAVVRILLPEVNIAAATALQALRDDARIDALGYGANVIMPNVTPRAYRLNYNLYDKKGGLDDDFSQTIRKLNDAIVRAHRVPALNMFGASVRYQRRLIEPS